MSFLFTKRSDLSDSKADMITVPIGGKPLNQIIDDGEIAPSISKLDILDLNEYLRLKEHTMSDIDKSFVQWVKSEVTKETDEEFLTSFHKEISGLPSNEQ
jgi:hypothetical protein